MSIEDKHDLLCRFLKKCCFSVDLNMNDTFGYACAESYNMDIHELDFVLCVYEQYEDDGINAFVAIRNKQDVIKPLQTEKYLEAKKQIKEYLSECGNCGKQLDPHDEDKGVHMRLLNSGPLISGDGFKYYCINCAVKKGL